MTEFTKAEQKVLDKSGPFEAIKIDSASYYNNYRILMITNDKNKGSRLKPCQTESNSPWSIQ